MIDWSSSDYTNIGQNLFYVPDVEGGVYLSKKDDINEHLCYQCSDKTKIELPQKTFLGILPTIKVLISVFLPIDLNPNL